MALETTRFPLHGPNISWTYTTNSLKLIWPEFLHTLGILLRRHSIAHALSGIDHTATYTIVLQMVLQLNCSE